MSVASSGASEQSLRILCIVPFQDEARYLPRFLASIAAQDRSPDLLVLVDDGSADDSASLAEAFAGARDDAVVVRRRRRAPARDRLAHAPELRAFLEALEQVDSRWDVVVKMDADLELSVDLFATIERELQERPALGIAGTYLAAPDERTGRPRRERCAPNHVRGANKFYRRRCLEQIGPIPQILGWDTIDEIAARMHGWETESIECRSGETVHLRPTGAADGRLRAQYRWGACAFGIGQHPAWVLLSAARRLRDRPALLGGCTFLVGWATAAVQRRPRADANVRAFGRGEQLAELRQRVRTLVPRRRLGDPLVTSSR
jgi:poly-beta-1,6-N-acetyl-D-glucosamine synthase